ncbi:unnamed protein product [Strongylus vulgaris]|uniref:Uncharacterized protein n=1 Tax=Strongylus vulgaris TaxID=40348 RepID=A0A3P7IXF5_STRVU|nr:unnamed protein product [Strongylus vulgaris]
MYRVIFRKLHQPAQTLRNTYHHQKAEAGARLDVPLSIEVPTGPQENPIDGGQSKAKSSSSATPESVTNVNSDRTIPSDSKNEHHETKVTRSKHTSISVKAAGAGKVRISSSVVESASSSSKARLSPGLLNVRRSSRSHTMTKKMLDSELVTKGNGLSTPTISKPVDPNSALGILQRVSRFTRPIRSPSPQPLPAVHPPLLEQPKDVTPTVEQPAECSKEELPVEEEKVSSSATIVETSNVVTGTDTKLGVSEKNPEIAVVGATNLDAAPESHIVETKEKSVPLLLPSPKVLFISYF